MLSIKQEIHKLVDEWYGCHMPCRIVSAEEEVDEFMNAHQEIPATLWEFVNHITRHIRLWRNLEHCVDIVVIENGQPRMVQDIYFCDEFATEIIQVEAVAAHLRTGVEYWLVFHQD